ncbi:Hypothetical predicted protein [Mytilus galloprovincialis]|uniref:MAM domain-containing protein n=1 Tax=Mytilus galloprovincialis TaxID=29158 RepID=A0A8B6G926_MYTGA|nr:Hypothetical predicted protein [Mytilus galloprovincialis]
MYGRNIGTLNVYTKSGNITKNQWSKHKNQGNSWKFANFDISETEPYRIIFEGIRGDGYTSDIALDDISLHRRSCPAFNEDCDFERGNCNWSTDSEKTYIWTISSGPTRSRYTGPDNDHTTGLGNGHYIYLNGRGSDIKEGMQSNLTSATIRHGVDVCFTFWYHMFGKDIGRLNVYTKSKKITRRQWSQYGNQRNAWKFANFTISKTEPFRIIFEGTRGDGSESDIALDDISLIDGSCSGLIKTSQTWKTDESISLHECSKYYLQLNETSLVFDRQLDNCSAVYQDVQTSVTTLCNNINNSDICTFYLPKLIRKDERCFPSNPVWLTVEYNCKAVGSSTTSPVIATKKGSSKAVRSSTTSTVSATTKGPRKAAKFTTLESVATSRNVSNAIGDTSGTSVLATGFVVGLIIGGVLLACVVIVIFVLIIRHKSKSRPKETKRNILRENDYIGSQDIALPLTAHHSRQNQNDGKFKNTSNVVRHETILSDNQTLNDERYSIGDQTAETSFKKTLEDGKGTTGSYIVLDPSVTGFNRTKLSKTPSDYEFGKPVIDTEIKIDDEDKYAICEEGVYDHSGNNRYKESEVNIYNHAVDNIYDSGSQKRNDEGRDDTYDHFFGQKTEDDYDITRT